MQNSNIVSITIANNISVTVPASLQFMTTFILHEQNDWFEDEMEFVRRLVRPGMQVIDIGANYGLYTLSIAKLAGDTGRVWAFEPTAATAACLRKSISDNRLANIELIQAGLSDRLGEARFYTVPNSELNTLSREAVAGDRHETIQLLTLDHCRQQYGWDRIDFIKLDAEGEESNIIKAARETLSSLSPLIMFEFMHMDSVNLPLIITFRELGYVCYRLVPGLNTLVPFEHGEPFDCYLLNLFCCKEDRARQLEREGYLVRRWDEGLSGKTGVAKDYIDRTAYGASLNRIMVSGSDRDAGGYGQVLDAYVMSLSEQTGMCDRVACLMAALRGARVLLAKGEQGIERLVTFARIAFDAGERGLGITILADLVSKYAANIDFDIQEPLLPACPRYDRIDPGAKFGEWLFSSILEQCILKHAFSTYYSRQASLPLFEQLSSLPFMSNDMRRRHQLVRTCFPQ